MIIELVTIVGVILLFFYGGYFALMHKNAKKKQGKTIGLDDFSPLISIIIPAYNEEKMIYSKLVNTLQQSYKNFEVIVANDGSEDNTLSEVNRFNDEHPLDKIHLISFNERRGKSIILSDVVGQAKGEILVFTDADTILDKDSICHLIKPFEQSTVGVITGKLSMVNYSHNSLTGLEKNYRSIFDTIRLGESNIDSTPIINGALMAIRTNLFDNISGSIADDTEVAIRTREKGFKVLFEPSALVYSKTPKDFSSRATQKIRSAQGIIQSFVGHSKILFNSHYKKYGRLIFPSEFILHVIAPVLVIIEFLLLFPFLALIVTLSFNLPFALAA